MYEELDKRIVDAVARRENPLYCKRINEEATRIAEETGRVDFRVIDGRLQALRKTGKIRYLTKAESNGQGGWHVMHARVPVDRVAVWVTGPGEHFTPNKRVLTNDSETPIETRPFTTVERKADGFIDLSGRRVGRLTVLGIAREFTRQWVVRCDCGRYTTRTAKAIKNPGNTQDRCEHCRHLAFLKREERWRRTGRNADIRDF